jgi:hypothetical protein
VKKERLDKGKYMGNYKSIMKTLACNFKCFFNFKNNLFLLSADWSLEALLYKWDMKCVHIPLESFDADKENIAESALPGRHTVEMLIISFAKDSL